jgi:hypothetical protein
MFTDPSLEIGLTLTLYRLDPFGGRAGLHGSPHSPFGRGVRFLLLPTLPLQPTPAFAFPLGPFLHAKPAMVPVARKRLSPTAR